MSMSETDMDMEGFFLMKLHFTVTDRCILKAMVSKMHSISAVKHTVVLMSHAGLNQIIVKCETFLLYCHVWYESYIYGPSVSNMKCV